jgi:2-polyprenylphenol 6-hydroxylase
MTVDDYDVAVIGAGMSGLLLTWLLARAEFRVALIERQEPNLQCLADQPPGRVSALNANIVTFLKQCGLWELCHHQSHTPLRKMHVWDHQGGGEVSFDSAEIARPNLACVTTNQELVRMLWGQVKDHANVTLLCPQTVAKVEVNEREVNVVTDTQHLKARLLVGADGAQSWLRQQLPFITRERAYQQRALVATVASSQPHRQVALQSFLPSGPLGVLPLAHENQSSIVWSSDTKVAHELLSMPVTDFNQRLSEALQYRWGDMELVSELKSFPLVERSLQTPFYKSVVLIGDAAHTIHPLAGQGANCGLQDAIWLADILMKGRDLLVSEFGNERLLARYWRRRQVDYQFLRTSMRFFADFFHGTQSLNVSTRSAGLSAVNQWPCIKKKMMQIMTSLGQLPICSK